MADASAFDIGSSDGAQAESGALVNINAALNRFDDRASAAAKKIGAKSGQRDLDFIYVGSAKSASSWLFEILRGHPGAYVLPSKSSGFFETKVARPIAPYRALLAPAPAEARIGEIAHDAYLYPDTAKRLREAFPDVRIIACLREPGDLARSILKWWSTHTRRFGRDVAEMTEHPHFRQQMDFALCLAPFFAEFPADQIKIMFFDDLVADPHRFHAEICDFIGLDASFQTAGLSSVVNGSRQARIAGLTKMIYALGGVGRQLGLGMLVEKAKRARPLEALLYSERPAGASPAITEAALRERALAQSRLASLEQLIGRCVPISWWEKGAQ